ncbi:MAG TPA: Asp-tRNA(Asn)/Glu-tRNA(Gln) amidotransferase subunit GatC [Candidatus Nanoarchaeia archaeon]|nr:Asp-tRNA(Asn)/Glu-tRNA(Gln) amidotransferase subunit GatC [Candidatus Nanoarchaeia archaeon]
MNLDKELIKKVAKNSRLELTEEEIKEFLPQLKEILSSFSKLQELDTEKVKPSFQPLEIKNILREDKPLPCKSQEEILSNTNLKQDGYFKGPKAL